MMMMMMMMMSNDDDDDDDEDEDEDKELKRESIFDFSRFWGVNCDALVSHLERGRGGGGDYKYS